MRALGVDLAWAETTTAKGANETGVVALDPSGVIVDAGWIIGIEETVRWIDRYATDDTIVFVDAPLVVSNSAGQRRCETQVGQRYGRWKVSANSTNLSSPRLAGVSLRRRLEAMGWRYDDGFDGPPDVGRVVSECYPYTTLVGAPELGYELERPVYKRKPKSVSTAAFRQLRADNFDELVRRVAALAEADPPLHLRSHPATLTLIETPSPTADRPYKHREDLLDAALCAWTAQLWDRYGFERCQVLGDPDALARPAASIIAPCRPEQRRL
jgi:predicted RNase H-like nuclease